MKKLLLLVAFACFAIAQSSALNFKDETLKPVICDQVTIPDRNFEQALLDQNIDTDGLLNGKICRADAEAVTALRINDKNISNTKGIEAFINLRILNLDRNLISSLDVTKMKDLTDLSCPCNLKNIDLRNNVKLDKLNLGLVDGGSGLDLSNNKLLKTLITGGSGIQELDLSANTSLQYLQIVLSKIKTIDLSRNLDLRSIWLDSNDDFRALDVSRNKKVGSVRLDGNVFLDRLNLKNGNNRSMIFTFDGAPLLYCIEVDNANYSNSAPGWENLDAYPNISYTSAGSCQLVVPGPVVNPTCVTYAFGPSTFLALNWSGSFSFLDSYEIEVDVAGKITEYNSGTSQQFLLPLPGTTYRWRVRPTRTITGRGIWSDWISSSQCPNLTGRQAVQKTENIEIDDIRIYPNPAKKGGKLFIQSDSPIKNTVLYDLRGKQVYNSNNSNEIDLHNLEKGIYILRGEMNNKVITKRIVVE